jgi:hypothetical protein
MTKKAISAAKRAAVIKAYLTLSSFNSSFQILERSSFVCFSASLTRSSRYFTWVADAKYCRSDNDVATVPPDESNEIGVSERWSSGHLVSGTWLAVQKLTPHLPVRMVNAFFSFVTRASANRVWPMGQGRRNPPLSGFLGHGKNMFEAIREGEKAWRRFRSTSTTS